MATEDTILKSNISIIIFETCLQWQPTNGNRPFVRSDWMGGGQKQPLTGIFRCRRQNTRPVERRKERGQQPIQFEFQTNCVNIWVIRANSGGGVGGSVGGSAGGGGYVFAEQMVVH